MTPPVHPLIDSNIEVETEIKSLEKKEAGLKISMEEMTNLTLENLNNRDILHNTTVEMNSFHNSTEGLNIILASKETLTNIKAETAISLHLHKISNSEEITDNLSRNLIKNNPNTTNSNNPKAE